MIHIVRQENMGHGGQISTVSQNFFALTDISKKEREKKKHFNRREKIKVGAPKQFGKNSASWQVNKLSNVVYRFKVSFVC